jgi:hypothetical protein
MTTKQSQSKKRYWANVTPEKRSAQASLMAKSRWAKMTAKERSIKCREIIMKRWNKKLISDNINNNE